MPPREAKGRYLTREYMADAAFHREHDAVERELYMLLALFTDDAGWMEWDRESLIYSVYRFDDDRTRLFDDGVKQLAKTGRLRVLKCGHAWMPKVAKRPRSGEHEYRVRDEHQVKCGSKLRRPKTTMSQLQTTRPPNLTKPNLNHTGTSPNVEVTSPRGRARGGAPRSIGEEMSEFRQRVPRPGGDDG
jgi:hypothetical protein